MATSTITKLREGIQTAKFNKKITPVLPDQLLDQGIYTIVIKENQRK
jgi:hypothetical protein